jgi:hypothetical protein
MTEWEDSLEDSGAMLLEPREDYDSCVVGIGHRFHDGPLAVYSIPKVLQVLEGWGMTREEAEEFFEYNTIGAWAGDGTPLFVWLTDDARL